MGIQVVTEVSDEQGEQAVLHALESCKARLRSNIERTRQNLDAFERRDGMGARRCDSWPR
jgi:hypothetical protein